MVFSDCSENIVSGDSNYAAQGVFECKDDDNCLFESGTNVPSSLQCQETTCLADAKWANEENFECKPPFNITIERSIDQSN